MANEDDPEKQSSDINIAKKKKKKRGLGIGSRSKPKPTSFLPANLSDFTWIENTP